MFFEKFYDHFGPLPLAEFENCVKLASIVDVKALEDAASITEKYPAFYECLGAMFKSELQDGSWYNPKYAGSQPLVEQLDAYIQSLQLPCLKGKMLYSISSSIMKPHAYIDWHYDNHVRSMISERLHVPIDTNGGVVFYSKWFSEQKCYGYPMMPGSLYRLNNRAPHAVDNNSDRYRTHLVLDYMDVDACKWLRAHGYLKDLFSFLLSPITEPRNNLPAKFIGTSQGELIEPFKLFKYSQHRVNTLPIQVPENPERNTWNTRAHDKEFIDNIIAWGNEK